jgi:fructokinase
MRLGIDLGGTKMEGIALDGGRELSRLRVPTPRDDYDATLHAIADLVGRLEASALQVRRKADTTEAQAGAATVGIGIPGTISPQTGLVKNANSTWLIGRPLQADLERLLGRAVRIANDANCFAMSEATDGAGIGADVVLGVIVGTGTGAGVVVRGRVLTGPHGIAGEWGHNPLPWPTVGEWPGRQCYCGKTGCIETFLSGPGFVDDFCNGRTRESRPAAVDIVKCAESGDIVADAALQRYESRMARALASVINVLDPDVVVLGGGMSNIARLYDNVPRYWNDLVFSCGIGERVRTRLVRATHGDSSGVRGAAWLWNDA